MTTTHLTPNGRLAEAVGVPGRRPSTPPVLDLVIPVHDEERALAASVRAAHAYVTSTLPFAVRLTIADNASSDATLAIARALADELPGVRVVHLDDKGRGRALHSVWSASDALVLAYMDVDLSTDLAALLPLVAPLLSGHSEVAIGTRLGRGSRVVRGPKREVISRGYNLLLRGTLAARFSDAQCGFKAIRADAARQLLPLVEDAGWFFDTELLVLAERTGLRIHEVPVDWVDDPDSRVHVVATASADLRGIWRLGRDLARGRLPLDEVRTALGRPARSRSGASAPGRRATRRQELIAQIVRFAGVGVVSTVAYAVLFLLLQAPLGAQWANFASLLVTAMLNTALNRRHTFGLHGPGSGRHQLQGLLVFALGWALTSGSLAALRAATPGAGHGAELVVLSAANLGATLLRFLLFRAWVFRAPAATTATPATPHTEGDPR